MKEKIAFIICVNNEVYFEECCWHLERLILPEGFEKDIIAVREADSMAAGYNAAMKSSNAKYKVYIHQDMFIYNSNFIEDIINIFKRNEKIGMIGLVGGKELSEKGIIYNSWDCGRVFVSGDGFAREITLYQKEPYMDVMAVDGMLMATQYDIFWREDIFKSWDFYDVSHSFEFIRRGYLVVVPFQKNSWGMHDCGCSKLKNYDENRKILLKEYADFLAGEERDSFGFCYSKERADIWDEFYETMKCLIDNGDIKNAKVLFGMLENSHKHTKLRTLQHIIEIGDMEKKFLCVENGIFEKNLLTEELLQRYVIIKFYIRRLLFDNSIKNVDIYQWLISNEISSAEIIVIILRNIISKEKAIDIFIEVYRFAKEEQNQKFLENIKNNLAIICNNDR